jgi:pyrroloquinoline quinone biosynthesis protein E
MNYYKINENIVIRREYFGGAVFNISYFRNNSYFITDTEAIDVLRGIEGGWSIEEINKILRELSNRDMSKTIEEIIKESLKADIISETNEKPKLSLNKEEFLKERERIMSLKTLSAPLLISIDLTFKCNQHCRFCYEPLEWRYTYKDKMRLEEWKRMVDEAVNMRVPMLDLFGGEPFIFNNVIDLIEYINTKPMNFIVSSNGTQINEEIAKRLSALDRLKFYTGLSLEDYNAEGHDLAVGLKGAFDKIIRAIKLLKTYNVNFGVNTVVTRNNIDHLEEMYKLLIDLGVPQFTMSYFHAEYPYLYELNSEVPIEEFYRATERIVKINEKNEKKMRISREGPFIWLFMKSEPPKDPIGIALSECQVGKSRIEILPDGYAVPCVLLAGKEKYLLGNFLESSLQDIWSGKNMDAINKLIPLNVEPCNGCRYKEACKGGCIGYMLNRFNKEGYPDARCPIVRGIKVESV